MNGLGHRVNNMFLVVAQLTVDVLVAGGLVCYPFTKSG